jgi:hypothetical protein
LKASRPFRWNSFSFWKRFTRLIDDVRLKQVIRNVEYSAKNSEFNRWFFYSIPIKNGILRRMTSNMNLLLYSVKWDLSQTSDTSMDCIQKEEWIRCLDVLQGLVVIWSYHVLFCAATNAGIGFIQRFYQQMQKLTKNRMYPSILPTNAELIKNRMYPSILPTKTEADQDCSRNRALSHLNFFWYWSCICSVQLCWG